MNLISQLPSFSLPGCGVIAPLDETDPNHEDADPRGLIKLWEPPRRNARYVMGIDASVGITNWSRENRYKDDAGTDNGAIEIIRCGNGVHIPDVQVAEYAAPIDAEDLADVAVLLGRLYSGNSEMGEALTIIEIYPGPGLLTQRRMTSRYGYQNFFRQEYLNSPTPKASNSYGWTSTAQSLALLWSRFSRHYAKGLLDIHSAYLLTEMASLRPEPGQAFPQPSGARVHDDRVRAMATASWCAHDWSLGETMQEARPIDSPQRYINPQASDMTSEEYDDWAEERFQEMLRGTS